MKYFKKYCLFAFCKFLLLILFGVSTTCHTEAQFFRLYPQNTTPQLGYETQAHFDSTALLAKKLLVTADSLKAIAKQVLTIVDWSTGAAVTGFSALTTNICYYVLCGAFVEVHFNFAGTGSGTTVSFTLPFTSYNFSGGAADQFPVEISKDNGSGIIVPADGKAQVIANSTTCNLFKTAGATVWVPLLTRQSAGQFRYLKAP